MDEGQKSGARNQFRRGGSIPLSLARWEIFVLLSGRHVWFWSLLGRCDGARGMQNEMRENLVSPTHDELTNFRVIKASDFGDKVFTRFAGGAMRVRLKNR